MPFADVNGAKIYYEIAGSGETVVFLHAGIADSRMWDGQFTHFAEHYRVLRYDLRGYGQTTAPADPFSHLDDLLALLDQLGIERSALIGCSLGGGIALDFLLTSPDRVSALVMVCSSPRGFKFEGDSPALWSEIIAAFEAGDLERTSRLETQLWAVGLYREPEQVDAKILDLVNEMNLITLRNEAGNGEEQPPELPSIERLAEVRAPMLILVGELDSPVIHEAGKLMQAQIAGAQQEIIANTAHLPSMERPDEFNHIVRDFLHDTR